MVGKLEIEVYLPASSSLKAKRAVLNRIKARVRSRFNAAVAELDHQDLWQRASLGVAVIGSEYGLLRDTLDKVFRAVDTEADIDIVDHSIDII